MTPPEATAPQGTEPMTTRTVDEMLGWLEHALLNGWELLARNDFDELVEEPWFMLVSPTFYEIKTPTLTGVISQAMDWQAQQEGGGE